MQAQYAVIHNLMSVFNAFRKSLVSRSNPYIVKRRYEGKEKV